MLSQSPPSVNRFVGPVCRESNGLRRGVARGFAAFAVKKWADQNRTARMAPMDSQPQDGIAETLVAERIAAMKSGDRETVNVIRQVESEVSLAKSAKGFDGDVDDELYMRTIAAYAKKMEKARSEFEAAGDRGKEQVAKLTFEINYLHRFLPRKLSDDETRDLVRETINKLGVSDPDQKGRVVGAVMRTGAEVDGGVVARIVAEEFDG